MIKGQSLLSLSQEMGSLRHCTPNPALSSAWTKGALEALGTPWRGLNNLSVRSLNDIWLGKNNSLGKNTLQFYSGE